MFDFAYYSHHKCATRWTNSILWEICFHAGIKFKMLHGVRNWHSFEGLDRFVEKHKIEFLSFTNARQSQVDLLEKNDYRGFHVVRDPRDVLVSAYHSHKGTHSFDSWPELEAHKNKLRKLPKEEGLLEEIEFSRSNFENMMNWDYNKDNIMEIKMEELVSNPYNKFNKIMNFLDLPVIGKGKIDKSLQKTNRAFYAISNRMGGLPEYNKLFKAEHINKSVLEDIIEYHEIEKVRKRDLRKRKGGKGHYRKEKRGWEYHFTDKVREKFNKEYKGIVTKLNYE